MTLTIGAVALSIALGGNRRHDPQLDVSDEGSHYAYVVALRSGHLPVWGDILTLQERKLDDCLQSLGTPPAQCGSRPPAASRYPADGYDYEAQQPPLGYLPYVLTANPSAPPDSAIAAARRGGIIWVAISGGLLLALAWFEELSLLGLTALLATCLFNPIFTHYTGTVTNDAAAVAAGTTALLAWSWSRRRPRWSLALGVCAGILIGLTKGIFIVVPFALLLTAVVEEGRELLSWTGLWKACRRHLCVISMFVATAVTQIAWLILQDERATVSVSVVMHALLGYSQVATLQPSAVSGGLTSSLALFEPYYPYAGLNLVWGFCAFGVLIGVWVLKIPEAITGRVRGIALGVLAGILLLALGWPLISFVQGHYNQSSGARYCIALLPLIAYAIVKGCRRFGVVFVGVVLPLACAVLQLGINKY